MKKSVLCRVLCFPIRNTNRSPAIDCHGNSLSSRVESRPVCPRGPGPCSPGTSPETSAHTALALQEAPDRTPKQDPFVLSNKIMQNHGHSHAALCHPCPAWPDELSSSLPACHLPALAPLCCPPLALCLPPHGPEAEFHRLFHVCSAHQKRPL